MELIKTLFPLSFPMEHVKNLIMAVLIYLSAGVICGLLFGLLSFLPLIGFLFGFLGALAGVYLLVGVVLATLSFCKIL